MGVESLPEILLNGWAIVDLSDRLPHSDRKGMTLGVQDESGRLLCSYSSRNRIAKWLKERHGIDLPHKHRWRKNGTSTAGNQQWRCECGETRMDGIDGRGRPRKYVDSSERFLQKNRKKARVRTEMQDSD